MSAHQGLHDDVTAPFMGLYALEVTEVIGQIDLSASDQGVKGRPKVNVGGSLTKAVQKIMRDGAGSHRERAEQAASLMSADVRRAYDVAEAVA